MTKLNKTHLEEAGKKPYPFVLYRLPENDTFSVLIQQNNKLDFKPFHEIDRLSGFFIAPFRGKRINELVCLKPDVHFEVDISNNAIVDLLTDIPLAVACDNDSAYVMSKNEYLERANYLTEVLKDGDLRKVVMSRVIEKQLLPSFNIGLFLEKLMVKYPKAFVYLASLPGIGVWVGATPETLLSIKDDHAETMALAGTKPSESAKWTEKEIKEQQIVTDYIEELLFNNEITEYGKSALTTEAAGNVVHLKTGFNISLDDLKGRMGKVIKDMHPTPATCGLPRDKAYKLIKKVEKHDRQFYSGFLGPWNIGGQSDLFVNLRCAEICSHKMSLYVGGGLTADSNPEAEWEETIHKSKTLLSVVENL